MPSEATNEYTHKKLNDEEKREYRNKLCQFEDIFKLSPGVFDQAPNKRADALRAMKDKIPEGCIKNFVSGNFF